MMTFAPRLLIVALAVATAFAVCACSKQANRLPGQSGTASTVAALTAPAGPYPRGQANPARRPDPATIGPVVSITAPQRGSQVTGSTFEVVVLADDQDGVAEVTIAGMAVPRTSLGEYRAWVSVPEGLSLVPVSARDALGNVSDSYVSVTRGSFQPEGSPILRSVAASLTQDGLDRLERIAEQKLATLDLGAVLAAKNPVYNSSLIKVNVQGLRFGQPRLELNGASQGATGRVELPQLGIDIQADVFGSSLAPATLSADLAVAAIDATISQQAFSGGKLSKQALGLKITNVQVTLQRFRIQTASPALDALLSPFQGLLALVAQEAVEAALESGVDGALGGSLTGLDQPLLINVPTPSGPRPIGVQLEVDSANGAPGVGLDLVAGGAVTCTPMTGATDLVLTHGLAAQPPLPGPEPFGVTLSSDLVNRFLHCAWRCGVLQAAMDGTLPPTPTSTFSLSVGLLYPFFPVVRDLAPDPATPIVIEVALGAAPVVEFGQGGNTIELGVGEAEIRLLIDYMDGGPRQELFTIQAGIALEAEVAVQGAELRISRLTATQAHVEVVREPAADLDDRELENFLNQSLPWIVDRYATGLIPPVPIPALPMGLALTTPRIETTPGFLTIHAGL